MDPRQGVVEIHDVAMNKHKSIQIAYGELRIAEESIGLYYAQAARTANAGIQLLISNVPTDPAALLESSRCGTVHAVQLDIAPDGRKAGITVWSNRLPLHSSMQALDRGTLQYLSSSVITGTVPSCQATIGGIPFHYSAQYAAELDAPAIAKAA